MAEYCKMSTSLLDKLNFRQKLTDFWEGCQQQVVGRSQVQDQISRSRVRAEAQPENLTK